MKQIDRVERKREKVSVIYMHGCMKKDLGKRGKVRLIANYICYFCHIESP